MTVDLLAGERRERESRRAVEACNDYLRLGPGRSLTALLQEYAELDQSRPPTRALGTLKLWSQRFEWQARADAYDAEIERRRQAEQVELDRQAAERRREVMQSGLALDFERVERLKRLEALLLLELADVDEQGHPVALKPDSVWAPDVKQIGGGESAERVDIVRFNRAIFETVRGLLDDLAKETGGRKQQLTHGGEMAVVGMTLAEWRARQEQAQQQAEATLADFEDNNEDAGDE
jgi:hypothetical protein